MQRIVVYMPQVQHKKLKIKCLEEGETISSWFRGKVEEYIGIQAEDNATPSGKNFKKISEKDILGDNIPKKCGVRNCIEEGDKCLFKGEETYLCKRHREQIYRGPDARQLKVI